MDDERYYSLVVAIPRAFTPDTPIDSKELFAGRRQQVGKLLGIISQKGAHAVLFGERGVGKTSLANSISDFLYAAGVFDSSRARLNCADGMTFESMWRHIFKQFVFTQDDGTTMTLDMAFPENPNSETVRETFQLLNDSTLVIIDEFDRITDPTIKVMMADTIKTLSDNGIPTTLILVGVADSVDELIGMHPSIERSVKQVEMQTMSKSELLEIIDKGLTKCVPLVIEPEPRDRIADYSQGLPHFTHLLARESATAAIKDRRTRITMQDLEAAIKEAVDNQGGTNLTLYHKAVTAPRGMYFKPVLLACALATKDEKGFFYAKDVIEPLRMITGKDFESYTFAQHLKDFSETRGPILQRDGKRYRFTKPLMAPYVILRGLADALITESQLSRPSSSSANERLSLLSGASDPQLEL